jgi:HEAT repeat protein
MTTQTPIHSIIDNLCEAYSPEAAHALEAYGNSSIDPIVLVLGRGNVDPYAHETFAEILINILLKTQNNQTVDILQKLTRHANGEVRRRAVDALQHIGDERAIHVLRDALDDEYDAVQYSAAYALIHLLYGQEDEVSAYIAALNDNHPHVRYIAVKSLEFLQSLSGMLTALENDSVAVRRIGVYALGRIRASESVNPLIVALRDVDFEVRLGAIWALGELKNSRAINEIRPFIGDDNDRVVRVVREALHKLGYRPR